jgi:hypothetical protein
LEWLPGQLAGRWGQMHWNSVRWGKKIVRDRLEQPTQDKNLLYLHNEPNEPTKEDPSHMCSLSPRLHYSFNSQQGPPPLSDLSDKCMVLSLWIQAEKCNQFMRSQMGLLHSSYWRVIICKRLRLKMLRCVQEWYSTCTFSFSRIVLLRTRTELKIFSVMNPRFKLPPHSYDLKLLQTYIRLSL